MKIIIDCDQQQWAAATAVVDRVMPGWRTRFDRIGWGNSYGNQGASFFVRRITDGLSVKQVHPERQDP